MRSTANRRARAPRRASAATGQADHAERPRADLYAEVTRRIVAELEAGRLPWVQPWGRIPAAGGVGLPRKALTGLPYSGINSVIPWGALAEHGYPSQGWLTFRQARMAGGAVRKPVLSFAEGGERGTSVVYADRFVPACPEPCRTAEAVIAASGVTFRIGGDQAIYSPAYDCVQVPCRQAFFVSVDYYRTCLHELTHATGHPSRVGRPLSDPFGSPGYAREELVAEMGSAFLCAALGIVPSVRHADYIASWLAVLRGDTRAVFRAASQASKAADWLLARHRAAREERAA